MMGGGRGGWRVGGSEREEDGAPSHHPHNMQHMYTTDGHSAYIAHSTLGYRVVLSP